MAKYVNSKVYTEHSLMDEVVYQTKIILANIVLKNSVEADKNETEDSIQESDYFIACKNGTMQLSFFPLTEELLVSYGYTPSQARLYINNRKLIPEKDRDSLLKFAVKDYINNYEEKNNYYRTLAGLPFYGTTDYDIYIDPRDPALEDDDSNTDFDFTIPIHKYTVKELNTLKSLGIVDTLIEEHMDDKVHYKYLKFLGGSAIDIYTARIAAEWDILFMPTAENLVKTRFQEIYSINRDIYLKRTNQLAYSWMSDYYEEMVMIMVLSQTFTDLVAELPEWYIRRDIFDLRSVKYFLESQGVKFFKEIPLKYQIKLVKNLNRLIKYKSTNKNIHDILEIFATAGTTVYKYFIYKDYLPDSATGSGIEIDQYGNKFKLAFLQVPIDDPFDKYIQDPMNIKDYDEVTKHEIDQYWDGDLSHELVRDKHAQKDFSIEGTKYMFFDYQVDMLEYQFQICYFIGMIFNSKTNIEDITIMVQSISDTSYYSLTDLCILLICLTGPYSKFGFDTRVHIPMLPENEGEWVMADIYDFGDEEVDYINYDPVLGGEKYDFGYNSLLNPDLPTHVYDFGEVTEDEELVDNQSILDYLNDLTENVTSNIRSSEDYYWIRDDHPELWMNTKWMICGFNLEVDLEELEKDISIRHSAFGFEKAYTLADFGCDTFIAETDINTVEKLNNVYMTNKECYDKLVNFIVKDCDTKDKQVVAEYIFDKLFLTNFDIEFYRLKNGELATTYIELLKERSYSLYKFYMELTKEPDPETRRDGIRIVLNDIVTTLEYFIGNQDNLQFIFSFVPTSSNEAIIQYIALIINFFKSWKVYFLDPASSYNLHDRYRDRVDYFENIKELKYKYWKDDHNSLRDAYVPIVQFYPVDYDETMWKEIMEIYGYYDNDPLFDNVYDGYYPILYSEDYIDANGGSPDSCIPFVMVDACNAGKTMQSKLGVYDLDGAYARDVYDYADVNGMDVTELPEQAIITNNFEYAGALIDGGFPGHRWSENMDTTISNTLEISSNALISTYYPHNDLKIYANGLYLGNDEGGYATKEMFDEASEYVSGYIEGYLIPLGENYLDFIKLFSSKAYMSTMVNRYFDTVFKPIINTTSAYIYTIVKTEENISEAIDELNEWYEDNNPYWSTF